MRVLGIIPARGGSKGVPRKNIKLLCGKPLLAYTAESALAAKRLTRVILSTDDPEIAAVGETLGLDVPFVRPESLAEDTTPTFPVVVHAIETLEQMGERYDAVCLLQPTNPLRRPDDIDGCIDLLARTGADSVFTVLPVPDTYNPKWVYWRNTDGRMSLCTGESEPVPRRQDLPTAYHREGSVYVTKREVLRTHGNLYGSDAHGYEVHQSRYINIDTPSDWQTAADRLHEGTVGGSNGR
jgi:CMP-N-acetylneuraminic acid synthetase